MASALAFSWMDQFCTARDALNEVACEIGSLSALLADVADTMVDDPEALDQAGDLTEWPTADRIRALIDSWKHHRSKMQAAWDRLSERERRQVGRMPPIGAPDPTRPFI